jgi:uncharacterized protein RhaS with RHS repeats
MSLRWSSRDPSGENAGINLYDYVLNRPINAVDPLGLEPGDAGGGDWTLTVQNANWYDWEPPVIFRG